MKLLYLLYKSKTNKKGICPIRCRLTFNKERKEFSTGLFISPNHWNSKFQLVDEESENYKYINTQLSLISQKLHQAFLFLQVNEINFDVHDIYQQYKGKPLKKERGVIEVYDMHSARIKKLIGIDIKQVTYSKYLENHYPH